MSSSKAVASTDPLKDLLGDVLARLEILESKAGVVAPKSPAATKKTLHVTGEVPAVKAYDAYVKAALVPLAQTCDALKLKNLGQLLQDAWEGVRGVVILASRSKAPADDLAVAFAPHLKSTQEAVQAIRQLRLDRDHDRHQKAVIEMLACLSWVLCKAPQQLPVPMVKETLGSAEFWSNRIRKDFKGKDETQIAFCDQIKQVILQLVSYIEEYHKTGLTFNPRGVSLAEAAIVLQDEPPKAPQPGKSPVAKRHPGIGSSGGGGNMAGLMGELNKRKSSDGSSAATGLKHVSKDQQTWRKEYKATSSLPAAPVLDAPKPKKEVKKKPLKGLPIFEYQDRGFKWVIENQTKETIQKEISKDGVINVEISDPKQQVYIYNCDDAVVVVKGKFKSLALDKCTNCSVVYDTLISSAEMVNCKKIKLQVKGICPVFTVDKTVNLLVWLSEESKEISTFTTSLSSEMNVCFPDGDDVKELPIPEQFVHKLTGSSLSSEVSDLYH